MYTSPLPGPLGAAVGVVLPPAVVPGDVGAGVAVVERVRGPAVVAGARVATVVDVVVVEVEVVDDVVDVLVVVVVLESSPQALRNAVLPTLSTATANRFTAPLSPKTMSNRNCRTTSLFAKKRSLPPAFPKLGKEII